MIHYIGIDNGVSGSVAILSFSEEGVRTDVNFFIMPVKVEQNYTKKKGNITRIDWGALMMSLTFLGGYKGRLRAFLERPMVNPARFTATGSALRALEATLIVLEQLGIPVQYMDSKEWQRKMLPSGTEKADLKAVSRSIGQRLYPECREMIDKVGDADSLLMAEYAWRERR